MLTVLILAKNKAAINSDILLTLSQLSQISPEKGMKNSDIYVFSQLLRLFQSMNVALHISALAGFQ